MKKVFDAVDKNRALILEAERYIWENPETGYKEFKTSRYLAERFEELGYKLDTDQVNAVFAAMKELADKKARIYDEDLEALVFSEVYHLRIEDRFRLSNLSVQTSMGSNMPATAAVGLQDHDEEVRLAGFGVGPVDAAFNVIKRLCGSTAELEKLIVTYKKDIE